MPKPTKIKQNREQNSIDKNEQFADNVILSCWKRC